MTFNKSSALVHERSLRRRHERHRNHDQLHDVAIKATTKSPSLTPSHTKPFDLDADLIDVFKSIISQLYPNPTPAIVPYNETDNPDIDSYLNTTVVSEPTNATQISTATKTAYHHHSPHTAASSSHRPSEHAIAPHSKTITISKLAEQETNMPHGHPSHSHKSPKPPHTDPEADEDGDDDNADDNDDDDDGRSDDDSHPAATPMVIPSATVSHPLPSMTADLENPTNKQTESEAVRADRANKIIGIAVGLGCVVIGAAGLSGIVIARKRDKARQVVLDDGELQTRWRPQSFLAVVTTAVSRAQQACQRDNSIKSNGSSESKHRRRQQASEGVTAV